MSRTACGAAVDRHESDRQRNTAVFKLHDTTKDMRAEEDGAVAGAALEQSPQQGEEEEEGEDYHDEYSDEYDDGLSGDYEMELPRGKFEPPRNRFVEPHCCCWFVLVFFFFFI